MFGNEANFALEFFFENTEFPVIFQISKNKYFYLFFTKRTLLKKIEIKSKILFLEIEFLFIQF